ncbi:MAG: S-layer protein [Bacteroidetes bacterium]|jgi:hypothetical protein|nr:S-layer protein [Bacteroidota bacterium]
MKVFLFFLGTLLFYSLQSQTIGTFAGIGTSPGFSGDGGPATAAQLYGAMGVAIDALGNIYIADRVNARIRKVNTSGIISTFAGGGISTGDGIPATSASLGWIYDVEIDAAGNIYFPEGQDNKIRKINTSGIITTIAGNGNFGFSGDGGPAINAEINKPHAIDIDPSGNIFISDTYNHRVRKINTSGIITTFAGIGTAGTSGDGGLAINAETGYPMGVAFDGAGNIYIADHGYSGITPGSRIRKVTSSGNITTIVGGGTVSPVEGMAATTPSLGAIHGMAFDVYGNLYFCDYAAMKIRKVNSSGIMTTVAGNGTIGYSGDGGPPTSAQMYAPNDITFDPAGMMYVAENFNCIVRKITVAPDKINEKEPDPSSFILFPNPASSFLNVITVSEKQKEVNVCNILGETVISKTMSTDLTLQLNDISPGVYFITVTSNGTSMTKRIVVAR